LDLFGFKLNVHLSSTKAENNKARPLAAKKNPPGSFKFHLTQMHK
jgi:hypothetical protein